ncbi:DUF6020 family protein [Planococcus beigongshangi]|uniref:DUF6020 family protein n=1 Tax=Planococcus beigongshangi TaxID=2782536 RepID=UPI00193B5D62|nr:DUF6020 family protein [Planococcus beigongshangi]
MKKTYLTGAAYFVAALFLAFTAIFYFQPIRDAHPVLIGAVVLVLFGLFLYIHPFLWAIREWPKGKKVSLAIFLPLFSVLAGLSLLGNQYYLDDNHWLLKIAVYIGLFISVAVIVMAFIKLMLHIKVPQGEQQISPFYVILYMLPMLTSSLLMFFAFYPAAMTPDSLSQWEESGTKGFSNWHPVMFTWLIMFLRQIWDNPGVIVLMQSVALALTVGYMGYIMKRFKVNSWIIWVVLIVMALIPVNAIMSITIWKDILYSTSLFFFSMLIFLIVKTKGMEAKKVSFILIFLLVSFVLVFFRHNGFPVFLITMIAVLVMYRNMWRQLLPMALGIIILHQIITGPVYTALDVTPSDPQEALSIPTQQIANIVVNDGDMTSEQRDYIDSILPLELWREKYNPVNVDPIKFSWEEYDRNVIYDDYTGYFKHWAGLVVQNPSLAVEAFLNQTSLVWQMRLPDDAVMSRYVTNIYHGNQFGLVNKVIYEDLTLYMRQYLEVDTEAEEYLWRPAVYLFLMTLFIYITYLRNNWRVWLILLPISLNTAAVMATMPAQDFRYLFNTSLFVYTAFLISLINFWPKGGLDNE